MCSRVGNFYIPKKCCTGQVVRCTTSDVVLKRSNVKLKEFDFKCLNLTIDFCNKLT